VGKFKCKKRFSVGESLPFSRIGQKKANVDMWISEAQEKMDPEQIFPTDLKFRTVDLADMFESSMLLESNKGQRKLSARRDTD